MANTDPIFLKDVKTPNVQLTNASGTAVQQIFTASADGGAITELTATSTDQVARIITLGVNNGTASRVIGEVSVPAGSGTNGTLPAINLLDATAIPILDADLSLLLEGTFVLEVNAKVAVTAARVIDIVGVGGNF